MKGCGDEFNWLDNLTVQNLKDDFLRKLVLLQKAYILKCPQEFFY